jgi:ribosomal protein L37AE/L43A
MDRVSCEHCGSPTRVESLWVCPFDECGSTAELCPACYEDHVSDHGADVWRGHDDEGQP